MTRVFPVFCENKKKICFFRKKALDICAENSIIGLTLERDGDNARTEEDGGPERPPGSLKESEMCLVTAQENFLEVKFTENRTDYKKSMKSLILAQNERWWRVLYMQVERRSNT